MAIKGEAKTKYMREYMRKRREAASGAPGRDPKVDAELAEAARQIHQANEQRIAGLIMMLEGETEQRKSLTKLLFRVVERYDPDLADELPDDPGEMVACIVEALIEAEAEAEVEPEAT
jgi:hypothetical protein